MHRASNDGIDAKGVFVMSGGLLAVAFGSRLLARHEEHAWRVAVKVDSRAR
jgi:hypothetical protein